MNKIDLNSAPISLELLYHFGNFITGEPKPTESKFFSIMEDEIFKTTPDSSDISIASCKIKIDTPKIFLKENFNFVYSSLTRKGFDPLYVGSKFYYLFVIKVETKKILLKTCKNPDLPLFCEKLQIWEFPEYMHKSWNMFIFCRIKDMRETLYFDYSLIEYEKEEVISFLMTEFDLKLIICN